MAKRKLSTLSQEEFHDEMARRQAKRMNRVDAMPADVRKCVHDYGLRIVDALADHGVTRAAAIRHLVETILQDMVPTRGRRSAHGPRDNDPKSGAEHREAERPSSGQGAQARANAVRRDRP